MLFIRRNPLPNLRQLGSVSPTRFLYAHNLVLYMFGHWHLVHPLRLNSLDKCPDGLRHHHHLCQHRGKTLYWQVNSHQDYGGYLEYLSPHYSQVVIVNLLNFVLTETRSNLLLLVLKRVSALNERISNDHYLSDESFLVTRLSDLKALQKLNKIRKLLTVNRDYDISELRVIFSKVIVKENAFHLKLNGTNDDSLALDSNHIIHEANYTFTKFYEHVSYPVYVYFRGSINRHGMK